MPLSRRFGGVLLWPIAGISRLNPPLNPPIMRPLEKGVFGPWQEKWYEVCMAGAEILRPPVHRVTLAQFAILLPLCLILLASDEVRAYSVLIGGLIAILPQAYFAALAFRWRGARSARAIARSGYLGQAGKFLLSVAGFALVFASVRPIDAPAVFVAYIAMLIVQIAGSWLLLRR
jgi:ATP synthase protein I